MSRRTSILKALVAKLNQIDGTGTYNVNLFSSAYPVLKFWDNVNSFPCVYSTTGTETREYLPANFTWAYLGISLKVYCKGEDSASELELLLEDIENVINANNVLVYDTSNGLQTTEILVTSIVTDEGLLAPYAVGEVNLRVRYHYPQI